MTHCSHPLTKDLLSILYGAGLSIRAPGAAPAHVTLAERDAGDGQRHLVLTTSPDHGTARVEQVLRQAGYDVDSSQADEIVVRGHAERELILAFSLPVRLPTLNPQVRTHWFAKRKRINTLCWEVHASLPPARRPRSPLEHIVIEIDRYNCNEPDQENLIASAKWLLDVMQPMHPKTRPYGLGIIREDARWCVHDLDVKHIASRARRTDVRIFKSASRG